MKKNRRMTWALIAMCLVVGLLAAGCGGGGSSGAASSGDGGEGAVSVGVFLDNAVSGLNYETDTQSGLTGADGSFQYREGETVRFALGDLELGQAAAKPVMTPLDLVDGADVYDPKVTRICRLLQSLDQDGDIGNGIQIGEEVRRTIGNWNIRLDAEGESFENDPEVAGFFAALNRAGAFSDDRGLCPADAARNHFKQTLATRVNVIDVSGKPSEFASAAPDSRWTEVYAPANQEDVDGGKDDADDVAREIEEADIIKIDGDKLFILNAYRGLIICDISAPDAPTIASRLSLSGTPQEMYIRDNRAYILTVLYSQAVYGLLETADILGGGASSTLTRIHVVDISDAGAPSLMGTFDLEGEAKDSRIVGDILYVVYSDAQLYWIYADAAEDEADGTDVYVASFDVSDPDDIHAVDEARFAGSALYIHVTEKAVFVGAYDSYDWSDETTVTYVDISDPAGAVRTRGTIRVPGYLADEYKMDYDDGIFRICTYQWEGEGLSTLYLIDVTDPDNPVKTGSLSLGKGEQLFATRFDGDRAYIVTYETQDPLWVVDLSDPARPEIKGELHVPGYSTHIEPMGDYLIALGVDDVDGWRVSVSLFDVSNPSAPALSDRVTFGGDDGWSSSSAFQDVKSFTVIENMGLILLPYSVSNYEDGGYYTDSRLQLIDYAADDLSVRGWVRQKGNVLRSRSYVNRLFSVSNDELQVIDATDRDNPTVTADVALASNIAEFIPLENGYGAQLVWENYTRHILRTVPRDDPDAGEAVGEIKLEEDYITAVFSHGDMIYVASNVYDDAVKWETDDAMYPNYYGATRISVYDLSDPARPAARGVLKVEGNYYQPVLLQGGVAALPYMGGGDIIQVKEDVLAFISVNYGVYYDYAEGKGAVADPGPIRAEDLAMVRVVDLSDPDNPTQVAEVKLDAAWATTFFANNSVLYYTYEEGLEKTASGMPQTMYYLGRVDLSDPGNPVTLPAINMPGVCMGFDGFGPYAFTVDYDWRTDGSTGTTFNAVKIKDDAAYLLDALDIDGYINNILISDGQAYLTGYSYSGGYAAHLSVIDLSDPQNMKRYDNALNDWWWTEILGAVNRRLILNADGGTMLYDASDPADILLKDSISHYYGWPGRVAFTESRVYVPLGYYGVWAPLL